MAVTFVTSDALYVSNIKNIELSAKLKRIPLDIPPVCNLQPTEVDILYLPSSINGITMKSFGILVSYFSAAEQSAGGGCGSSEK